MEEEEEAPAAKRSKLNPEEEEEENLRDFIRKFEKMKYSYYAFQFHLLPSTHPTWIDDVHAIDFDEVEEMGVPVVVRDLRHGKHLGHETIVAMTNNFSKQNYIQYSHRGGQFRGWNKETNRDVIVKKWDFEFPLRPFYDEVLPRFARQLELLLLNRDVVDHRNIAKLIGFSCETRLALVWDLKLTNSLHTLIPQASFTWDQRLKVARQVVDALKFFHGKKVAICNFFSPCINVDENFNIQLFELDRSVNLASERFLVGKGVIGGHVRYDSPEIMTPERFETEWFYASDVYHFGMLLLELTLSKCVAKDAFDWIEQANLVFERDYSKSPFQPQMKMILDLTMKCVQIEPMARPEMDVVFHQFHKIVAAFSS